MRNRDAVLQYQKVLADSGTLIEDINLVDPISAFYLEFEAVNGSTSNIENFISDVITKIEIVDGAEALYSVNLSELEALSFYKTKRTPVLFPSEWADGTQRHGVYLLFGRHLWDTAYAFNPLKFRNPQLRITSNLAAVRVVSATTAFTTGSLKATIVGKVMEGTPAPGKYLMAKEIESFTSAASGDKRVEMPTDYPWRLAMLRAYIEGSDVREVVTDLKLTFDTDKFIAFNRKVQQLDAEALMEFGRVTYKHDFFQASGDVIRVLPNMEISFQGNLWSVTVGRMIGAMNTWSSQITLTQFSDATTSDATDRQVTGYVSGHALHATLPIPFGLMNDLNTWLDPKAYSKAEFVLTQGVASAVTAIVLEQVRPN